MKDYSLWKVEWQRNGMVGVTDGQNHVVFTEKEWNRIRVDKEIYGEKDIN